MAWPNDDLSNTELDQGTDSPKLARAQLNALLLKVQAILAEVAAGETVWHSGNDGSGSGLDADTLDGKHLSQIVFAAGTRLMFPQASAPTGWTQVATDYRGHTLRVVNDGAGGGAGGGTGGTHDIHNPPSTAHTHTISHTHSVLIPAEGWSGGTHANARAFWAASSTNRVNDRSLTTGGPSVSDSGSNGPTSFAPKYVDALLCSKD